MLEQAPARQIDAGIDAVVIAGTTGESATLSDGEKLELFRRAKDYVGNRCKIIAGTGSNSTRHTMELSMAAEQTGVDGLLLVSPYYNKATPEGLYAHYLAVAHSVSLPVILYNVPTRTGVDIPVSVYRRLVRIPTSRVVKESLPISPSIQKFWRNAQQHGHLAGNDDMATPSSLLRQRRYLRSVQILPTETQALARARWMEILTPPPPCKSGYSRWWRAVAEVNPSPSTGHAVHRYDCGGCRLLNTPSTKTGKTEGAAVR